jgi:pyruvate formate lyase activating enzyme
MRITSLQYFSLDDGPGIRTTVFMSGCNLRCKWCHNPENLEYGKNDYEISEENLIKDIMKDEEIMKHSGGGVTFSGGEPLIQYSQLKSALICCKKNGLMTAIETAGNYKFDLIRKIIPYTDLIIIDCKAFSAEVHEMCTGSDNKHILDNIKNLHQEGIRFWVRVPIIPGFNANYDEINKIGYFLGGMNIERVELIPYHDWGIGKLKKMRLDYLADTAKVPTKDYMKQCKKVLSEYNLMVYIA